MRASTCSPGIFQLYCQVLQFNVQETTRRLRYECHEWSYQREAAKLQHALALPDRSACAEWKRLSSIGSQHEAIRILSVLGTPWPVMCKESGPTFWWDSLELRADAIFVRRSALEIQFRLIDAELVTARLRHCDEHEYSRKGLQHR